MEEKKIKKPKLLIVEDDEFLVDLLLEGFSDQKIEIEVAYDGEKALEKVKEVKPDLILLDILLPKIDGFEVLKRLKEDKSTANIPVVILSNLGQKEEIQRGYKLGAVDFLVKASFSLEEVVKKVKKYLSTS